MEVEYERLFGEKPKKTRIPMEANVHPELDQSEFLDGEHQTPDKDLPVVDWSSTKGHFTWTYMRLCSCYNSG